MKTTVEVRGLKELTDTLVRDLPARAQAGVVRRALKKAIKPMVIGAKAAYAQAAASTRSSGSLETAAATWGVSVRKRRRINGVDTIASIDLGPRRDNKIALAQYYDFYGKTPSLNALSLGIRHGHFIEFGVQSRSIGGKNILQRVADTYFSTVINNFRKEYGRDIERTARRIARRQGK